MGRIHRVLGAGWLRENILGSGGRQDWTGVLVLPCEPRDQSVVTFLLSLYILVVDWAITHVMTAPAPQAVPAGAI